MKRAVLALAVVVVICWTALVLSGATLRGPDWDSCQSDLESLTRATDDLSDQAGELSDLGQTVDQADDALESCETDSSLRLQPSPKTRSPRRLSGSGSRRRACGASSRLRVTGGRPLGSR